MDSKRAGGVAIFGVIALMLIWGLLSLIPNNGTSQPAEKNAAQVAGAGQGPSITVVHSAKDGMHTFSGVVEVGSTCQDLTSATSVTYDPSPVVTLTVTTTAAQTGAVCQTKKTDIPFSTAVSGKSAPKFSMLIDGKVAVVTLTEAK